MKKPLILPQFKNEDEEREFWSQINLADYFEPSDAVSVKFPNLKPSTQTISLRVPQGLLSDLKVLANKQDVPYQSLMKIFLAERVKWELKDAGQRGYDPRFSREEEKTDQEPNNS